MESNLTTHQARRRKADPGGGLTARRRALQRALVRAERRGDLAQVWHLLKSIRDIDARRWRLATGAGRQHNRRITR